jgi:hypothetical protein
MIYAQDVLVHFKFDFNIHKTMLVTRCFNVPLINYDIT